MQHKKFLIALTFLGAFPLLASAQNRVISTDNTNIAATQNGGRVLSATSTFDNDPLYAGSNLIDGQVWSATRAGSSRGWASNQYDPISMDAVTFGFAGNRVVKLGRVVINPLTDLPPERWAKDIEVQVSTESAEGPYQPVAQLTLRQLGKPQSFDILPVEARFVRLQFRSNYGSDRAVALGEVEMYEAIDASDPMGGVINRLEKAVTQLNNYKALQAQGDAVATPTAIAVAGEGDNFRQVQLGQGVSSGTKANIAAAKNGGRILASSSTYNNDAAYGPQLLIDGDNFRQLENKGSNGWASQGFEPGKEFVTIGFADDRTHLLGKVTLNPASNQSDLRWARRIQMETTTSSSATGPWKTAGVFNLRPEAVNQDFSFTPVEAKYARFTFQANGPGIVLPNADPNVNSDRAVSLGEIEIYEAQTGDDQLDAILGQFNGVLTDLKTLRRRDIDAGRVSALPFVPSNVAAPAAPKPKAVSTKPVLTPPATPTKVQSKIAPVRSIEKRIEAAIPKRRIGTGESAPIDRYRLKRVTGEFCSAQNFWQWLFGNGARVQNSRRGLIIVRHQPRPAALFRLPRRGWCRLFRARKTKIWASAKTNIFFNPFAGNLPATKSPANLKCSRGFLLPILNHFRLWRDRAPDGRIVAVALLGFGGR